MAIPESVAALVRERQSRALQAAEERVVEIRGHQAGKSRTQLAADVYLGYDQYCRYVNGKAAIDVEQIVCFAHAYGVDPDVLGRAIMTGDVEELTRRWDFRAALERACPDSPDAVDAAYVLGQDQDEAHQRTIADQVRRHHQAAHTTAHEQDERADPDARATGT